VSFPRYPAYRDSGVEWLGKVPAHWNVVSIKWLSSVKRGASPRPIDDPKYFDDEGRFAWVRISDVSACDGSLRRTTQRLSELGSSLSVKILPGQLFVSIAGTVGKPCITEIEACIHDGFVYFPTLTIDPKYLFRIFEAGICYGGLGKFGTQLNLNTDTIGSIRVAIPPAIELRGILAFLDCEMEKIDGLIAEQQHLIELLKEKRQTVISHAVTKGLSPDSPMKPSGVEWLGDVPEHWDIKPLKYSITKIEQGWSPQCESGPALENEWGVLKVGCGNRDKFDPTEQKALPRNIMPLPNYEIKTGDILVSRGNTLELVGMATYVERVRPRLLLCDLLYRFRAKPERADGMFLVLALRSPSVRFQIERGATGTSASMKKIGQGIIREFVVALPPPHEQRAIIEFCDGECAIVDTLTAEAQRAIGLLQERRSALISAAVTGQIDVRGLAQQEAA
jgi:type I restriction enzyme S subunit